MKTGDGGSDFGGLSSVLEQPIQPLTSEQIAQAQSYVASRALGAGDLLLLLDMLDLRGAA